MGAKDKHGNGAKEAVYMERTIGLLGTIGLVLGSIIGSGIFISPKGVVRATHSEASALLFWAIGGVVSILGSLSTVELASVLPSSAGDYVYLRVTYAHWVGFLFAWTFGFISKPSSQAVIAITSAQYIMAPLFDDHCGEPPATIVKMLACVIILLLTAVNAYSVRLSSLIQIVFTTAKVAALIVIMIGGIVRLIQGHTENMATGFQDTNRNPGEIIMGFYSAMFAYDGWNSLSYIVEEVKHPTRNIPLTVFIAMPLVTFLYVLVNVSYFTVMDSGEMLESPAVAVTWAEVVMPTVPWLMPVCVALSTFGSCNASILTSGRLFYVMARENEMPHILSMIHRQRKTPVTAAVLNCIFAIFYVFAGEVLTLIDYMGFATWLFLSFVQLSVIVLRFKKKDAARTYKVPIVFPAITFLFGMTLVIVPLVTSPQIQFLYAALAILAGLLLYLIIVVSNKSPRCMNDLTVFFQLLLDVCPTTTIAKAD